MNNTYRHLCDKYEALYKNEKDHSETLIRIICKLLDMIEPSKSNAIKPIFEEFHKDFFGKPPYKFTCREEPDLDE